jgi:hypothetical protein
MTPDEFFAGNDRSKALFEAVLRELNVLTEVNVSASKSQIAFRRRTTFAAVWMPGQYLKRQTVPLVLTVYLRARDLSPRWKQIVEPSHQRFTHHLELNSASDIDDQVRLWLHQAWDEAE